MEKGMVRRRILLSNVCMVLAALVLFLMINILIIFCYSESIEEEVKTSIEKVMAPGDIENMLKDYTIYRNEFILLFVVDGVLCIAVLLMVSQFFTKSLTEHIMEPLDELADGAKRIKANRLEQEISYVGDREFEDVCHSFNEMMRAISIEQDKNERYEKARTDMIAGISHDLRTPLTAVRGTIKGLLDGVAVTPAQQKNFLETAYRRTGDMDRLLNQLFYLSKMETGKIPVFMENIEISDFLRSYVQAKKDESGEDQEIINICTEEAGVISADPEQLQRILDNLLENSRKYADRSPLRIDLHLYRMSTDCCICVRDNGAGVSDEKLPYIFDEFYRGDESRNQKEGNGLGLYIVKCLMEEMNGSVSAENKNGFAVYLRFPLVKKRKGENSAGE